MQGGRSSLDGADWEEHGGKEQGGRSNLEKPSGGAGREEPGGRTRQHEQGGSRRREEVEWEEPYGISRVGGVGGKEQSGRSRAE
jgi:hypothetical protein